VVKALFASWVLEGRGRKDLWRGKPLFESFKKTWKGLWGLEGLHLSNFKVSPN